jgi:hypothetical protein
MTRCVFTPRSSPEIHQVIMDNDHPKQPFLIIALPYLFDEQSGAGSYLVDGLRTTISRDVVEENIAFIQKKIEKHFADVFPSANISLGYMGGRPNLFIIGPISQTLSALETLTVYGNEPYLSLGDLRDAGVHFQAKEEQMALIREKQARNRIHGGGERGSGGGIGM